MIAFMLNDPFMALLGPVYTERQSQRCNNAEMTLAILFSSENNGVV